MSLWNIAEGGAEDVRRFAADIPHPPCWAGSKGKPLQSAVRKIVSVCGCFAISFLIFRTCNAHFTRVLSFLRKMRKNFPKSRLTTKNSVQENNTLAPMESFMKIFRIFRTCPCGTSEIEPETV